MRVLVRGGQFNGQARFETWLFTIARNLVIDQRRKRTMNSLDELIEGAGDDDRPMSFEVAADDPTPFDHVSNLEDREKIAAALLELDTLHREVLVLPLPRRAVTRRDCQGHAGAAFYRKIKALSRNGNDQAEARLCCRAVPGGVVSDG